MHGLIHLYMYVNLEITPEGYIPSLGGGMMGDFYFLLYNFLYFMKKVCVKFIIKNNKAVSILWDEGENLSVFQMQLLLGGKGGANLERVTCEGRRHGREASRVLRMKVWGRTTCRMRRL